MKAKKVYYFAYGSNMSYERINSRVRGIKKVGTWMLKDWDMHFNCGHYTHSYANIFESVGKNVYGVLYEVSDKEIDKLDGYENYPHNYEKRYFVHGDGSIIYTYVSVSNKSWFGSEARPTIDYLNYLLEGTKENKLDIYHQSLLEFRTKYYSENEIKGNYANAFFDYSGYGWD